MAKGKAKTSSKKTAKSKVGIKDPQTVKTVKKKKATGKPPERIKMLMNLARHDAVFSMGQSYRVPQDIPVQTARDWVAGGVAEEDKSLDGPPESK